MKVRNLGFRPINQVSPAKNQVFTRKNKFFKNFPFRIDKPDFSNRKTRFIKFDKQGFWKTWFLIEKPSFSSFIKNVLFESINLIFQIEKPGLSILMSMVLKKRSLTIEKPGLSVKKPSFPLLLCFIPVDVTYFAQWKRRNLIFRW